MANVDMVFVLLPEVMRTYYASISTNVDTEYDTH
jgi:hypothetical protein